MAMPMLADWSLGTTIPAKDLESTRRFYETSWASPSWMG
jgi:hypothetical protein